MFRYTFQPDGLIMRTLTVINVILGVLAASIMPIHAAFMHRDGIVWIIVYALDILHGLFMYLNANSLMGTSNCSAISNDVKSVNRPLMSGLLHLVQRGGDWAGPQPDQSPPCCSKCNSPPINGQCTNHHIAV